MNIPLNDNKCLAIGWHDPKPLTSGRWAAALRMQLTHLLCLSWHLEGEMAPGCYVFVLYFCTNGTPPSFPGTNWKRWSSRSSRKCGCKGMIIKMDPGWLVMVPIPAGEKVKLFPLVFGQKWRAAETNQWHSTQIDTDILIWLGHFSPLGGTC